MVVRGDRHRHNCGLDAVQRIEAWRVVLGLCREGALTTQAKRAIEDACHDRMTEAVLPDIKGR